MEKASAVFMDEAIAVLRLFHREVGYAGALGAARRAPAGNGHEAPGAMRRTCIAIGPGVSLS
jgi:hypothetical protein